MKLDIATPTKSFSTVEVDEVVVPTVNGEIMVLPGHARLLSGLEVGTLSYRSPSDAKRFSISRGVVEVRHDHISILSDEVTALP